MPITFNLESGRLAGLLSRTKSSAADVTEAARASVSTLSTKATETIACAKLRMAIADLNDEIDLQILGGQLVDAVDLPALPDADVGAGVGQTAVFEAGDVLA